MYKIPFVLFHTTSSVFIEDIKQLGLGGKNIIKEYNLLLFLNDILDIFIKDEEEINNCLNNYWKSNRANNPQHYKTNCCLKEAQLTDEQLEDIICPYYENKIPGFTILTIFKKQKDKSHMNFQHGNVYLTSSYDKAIVYSKNKYGEFLSEIVKFIKNSKDTKYYKKIMDILEKEEFCNIKKIISLPDEKIFSIILRVKNININKLLKENGEPLTKYDIITASNNIELFFCNFRLKDNEIIKDFDIINLI